METFILLAKLEKSHAYRNLSVNKISTMSSYTIISQGK